MGRLLQPARRGLTFLYKRPPQIRTAPGTPCRKMMFTNKTPRISC